jgi:hypothetical protein
VACAHGAAKEEDEQEADVTRCNAACSFFHFDGPGGEEEVEAAAVIGLGRRRFWRQAEVDGWDGKTVGKAGRRGRLGW